MLGIATGGNMYLDEKAPWSQFKKGEAEREAAGQVRLAYVAFFYSNKSYREEGIRTEGIGEPEGERRKRRGK